MRERYKEAFGGAAHGVSVKKAPGRVNLIGEHTDYNDGYVLPVPINRHIWVAAKARGDDDMSLYAHDYGEWASFDLNAIRFDEEHLWANYVMGVAKVMMERGHTLGGANIVISGDVPQGAGLSSSAAIEMATARMFLELFDLKIDPVEMAYIGKAAENDFVGVQCGIMDQFVSALGRQSHALFIDCRTNEHDLIPLDPGFSVVVVNTMVKRELASSAYNERRRQCEKGVSILRRSLPGVRALRDVAPSYLEEFEHELPHVVAKRCRHVVSENARVLEAVGAMRVGDIKGFGELMYESHDSLREDYEVSCGELDLLVEAARRIPGTVGARMTGAGFGGCTVNLVRVEQTRSFVRAIKEGYRSETGLSPDVYVE